MNIENKGYPRLIVKKEVVIEQPKSYSAVVRPVDVVVLAGLLGKNVLGRVDRIKKLICINIFILST